MSTTCIFPFPRLSSVIICRQDLQRFSVNLNPSASAQDQLRNLQNLFPNYFSPERISAQQLLRLLQQVNLRGGRQSPLAPAAPATSSAPATLSDDSSFESASSDGFLSSFEDFGRPQICARVCVCVYLCMCVCMCVCVCCVLCVH